MKKEIKVCDVCGSEKDVHSLQMPVLRKYDAAEGKSFFRPMKLGLRAIDLCEDCLRKSTNDYREQRTKRTLNDSYGNWYCPDCDGNCEEEIGVKEPPSKTFPHINEFDTGSSYRR